MNNLQLVLLVNALFSLSTGLSLILFGKTIANWFGQQKQAVFWILGLGLVFFSSFVFIQIINLEPELVFYIVVLDSIWVVSSIVLLLIRPWRITRLGNKIIASIALVVLLFAVGQAFELYNRC